MEKSNKISKPLFEDLGYKVADIPTSDREEKKEADFLISYGNETAIVEAKIKEDEPKTACNKERDLSAGKVSIVETKLGRNETISGTINKAKKQLRSSSDKEHDFKLISFIATGSNVQAKIGQFMDTIYGSTLIVNPIDGSYKTCFFYRHSDFFRHRIIDAAVIGYEQGSMITTKYLAINPYSENYERIKGSQFIEPFQEKVIDPIELEKQGLAYIPDPDIDRKLTELATLVHFHNPIIQHLMKKYQIADLIIPIDFNCSELSVR